MNNDCGDSIDVVNIVISGVGGQGVLTLAEIMAKAALADSHNVRVGEIHGMAQRGGHVVCTVRIGPDALGPIVDSGTADLIIGFEPLETLREIALVKSDGYVLMSSHIIYPVAVSMGQAEYPSRAIIESEIKRFTSNILEFNAMDFAKQVGNPRAMNMVMMGATIGSELTPISKESAMHAMISAFPKKYQDTNIAAFELGYNEVHKLLK